MISYDIALSGPLWLYILLVLTAIGYAVYTYKQESGVHGVWRWTLTGLRAGALSVLLLLLFEPIVSMIRGDEQAPIAAVLIDNSISMQLEDAGGSRKEAANSIVESSPADASIRYHVFDRDVKVYDNLDSNVVGFDGSSTDISAAFRSLFRDAETDNIRSVVLVSDGNVNEGDNPIYDAELLGLPVYSVMLGDTTVPSDVVLRSVIVNDITYVGARVPVLANIDVSGYDSDTLFTRLRINGKQIRVDTAILQGNSVMSVPFEFVADTVGLLNIEVSVDVLADEASDKNNASRVFVKVLDRGQSFTIVAGAPGPDIRFLRGVLEQDKDVQVTATVQQKNGSFEPELTPGLIADSRVLVLYNFPLSDTRAEVIDVVAEAAAKGKPLLFIAGPQTDYTRLKPLEAFLPFESLTNSPISMDVQFDISPRYAADALLRAGTFRGEDWLQLPPVYRTELFVQPKPGAQVLATARFNGVSLDEPVFLKRSAANTRSVAILAWGLYRWKLLGYAPDEARQQQTFDVYPVVMRNVIEWLSVQDQGERVRLSTTKQDYAAGERIEVVAEVYDEVYRPDDRATVTVAVRGDQEREFTLQSIGSGRYRAELSGLGAGAYSLVGTASIEAQEIGTDRVGITVGEQALEYLDVSANAPLMRKLSTATGGQMFSADEYLTALETARSHANFTARPLTVSQDLDFRKVVWMMVLLVSLFAIEWMLRKRLRLN